MQPTMWFFQLPCNGLHKNLAKTFLASREKKKKKKTFKITKKKKKKKKTQKSTNDQSIVKTSKMPLNHLK